MNYHKIYNDFIKNRRDIENITKLSYFEKHHITPKSMGGGDEKENIICLTASDHLFAHKLLALIFGGKMWHALHMCNISDSACKSIRLCRRWFERVRLERSKHMSKTISGKNHHYFGKSFSEDHKKRLSESHIGKRTGKENNKYDPTIYNFRNLDGIHEKLTKSEFRKKYKMSSTRISDICNGNRPTANGWYVSECEISSDFLSKKGIHHKSVKNETYNFVHKSGISEFLTQYELRNKYKDLNQSHISSVCRGVRLSHKGWSIAN